PPRPRSLNAVLPPDVETICLKALEKEPTDRFTTARDFADELWRWLHDEPLRIRPPTLPERAWRWGRRHRAVARVVLAAVILLLAVSAVLGWTAWQATLHETEARTRMEEEQKRSLAEERLRAEYQVRALVEQARQRLRQPTQNRRREAQAILRQ